MTMTRKEFLGSIAAATALVACGSSNGSGADAKATSCTMDGTTAAIDDNTGHVLNVTTADVIAGAGKTYDIMGTADHTHNVEMTPNLFALLQQDRSAMVTSSTTDGHNHDITITCT